MSPASVKVRLKLAVLLAGLLSLALGWLLTPAPKDPPFDYQALRTECEETLQRSPREADLVALLERKKIPFKRQAAPFDKFFTDILEHNGIPAAAIPKAGSCIYFENVSIRKESFSLASHQARGYFIFDPAGHLLGHRISRVAFGI